MRATSKAPRSRMSRAASGGTMPAAAIASAAAVSTSSQVSYRRWSLQMRPISGCVYRAIISTQVQPFPRNLQAVHVSQHGRRHGLIAEQVCRHPLHVVGRHPADADEGFVETELPIEVDLLPGQMRHAAGGVLEAQHQAALQVILRALE